MSGSVARPGPETTRPPIAAATTATRATAGRSSARRGARPAAPPTRPRAVNPSGDVDEDVLRLGVEVQGGHPELAADARHLVAAERRLGVDRAVRVDRDHARLE